MRVAVTGAAGQLGSVTLERLGDARKVRSIVAIDRVPLRVPGAKIEFVQTDVRAERLGEVLSGCDAVVHLAFVVAQHLRREEFDDINVAGSRHVVEAARRAGVKRIVVASSIAAYGVRDGHPEPLVESSPRYDVHDFAYSSAKFRVEAFLDEFEARHPEVAIVRLRPSILFGARMPHAFGRTLASGWIPDLGDVPIPIVWDEDVADAIVRSLDPSIRGAFNLSAEPCASTPELARAAGLRLLRVSPRVVGAIARLRAFLARAGLGTAADPAWVRAMGVRIVVSSERARRELGWRPRFATALDVARQFARVANRSLDPRLRVFFDLAGRAASRADVPVENQRVNLVMHVDLTGPRGGSYTMRLVDGRATIARGQPSMPDTTATLPAESMRAALSGRTDISTLAFTNKLRIRGEPTGLMALQALVTNFRQSTKAPGVAGRVARVLSDWLRPASGNK